MLKESRLRTLLKTVSWRVTATVLGFIVVFTYTGKLSLSIDTSVLVGIFNTVAYYFHERAWNRLSWGRK
ncbi:MAG: DUF2061 domain-containing protein [Minisyncoccia bacterium]